MSKLILYHGSSKILEKPSYGKGKLNNDYGQGFYCTESIELAKEWACTENVDGFASKYELRTDDLKILTLTENKFTILNWLAILINNRTVRITSPVEKRGKQYLIDNFMPDYSEFDLIIGYRADDSYFAFARAFLSNTISLRQLAYAMKLGKLGEQVVLKSEKAFENLTYKGFTIADNSIYYPKRKTRDEDARENYRKELETDDINGIYMRDILREEMKSDDPRLQ